MLCFDWGESIFQVKDAKKEAKEKVQKENEKKQYVDADTRELLSKSEFKRRKKVKKKKEDDEKNNVGKKSNTTEEDENKKGKKENEEELDPWRWKPLIS